MARGTVTKWVSLYKKGGYEALKAKKQGRPKGGKLKGWQASAIARIVVDKNPEQLKFPWALWTRELVGDLIYQKYGIRLSVWTVGRYLKRWGFTPQKPLKRAYQRNPRSVEKWLHQEYPRIRYKAKKEHREIHWCDEMGVRSDHQTGTTWGQKGKTPVVDSGGIFRFFEKAQKIHGAQGFSNSRQSSRTQSQESCQMARIEQGSHRDVLFTSLQSRVESR